MAKISMAVNSVLILLDTIDQHHHEEDIDQDQEVAIVEDLDQEIEDEDHEAVLVTVDVEVAQDRATVEEDPDLEASPKDEVEAKRLLERRVVQDQDPNHEADLDQETLATDELN